jgi:hypothetical protein
VFSIIPRKKVHQGYYESREQHGDDPHLVAAGVEVANI